MPTELMSTDINECLLDLFIALANDKIECININNKECYNLSYEEKHLILYNISHMRIKTAKMTTIGYNGYRVIIDEELPDEVIIDINDDYMYCYKKGFPTEEEMEYLNIEKNMYE